MDHKIIDNVFAAWQDVVEKKKLDPVNHKELKGKHSDRDDKDVDNDGDVDSSDEYLHKRRKAISKDMKEKDNMEKCSECEGSTINHDPECSQYEKAEKNKMNKEDNDLDADNAQKALKHDCASHVTHESWGYGECIKGEHTLIESSEDEGYVTHYDIMFEHGVEFNVPVEDLNILRESSHGHMKRSKKKESKDSTETTSVKESTDETVAVLDQEIQDAYSDLQMAAVARMKQMYEKSYSDNPKIKTNKDDHDKGATPPEDVEDKESKKGEDFIDTHKKSDKEIEDMEDKSHDSVFDAARSGTKQAPTRGTEKRVGDLNPKMPKDTTKG